MQFDYDVFVMLIAVTDSIEEPLGMNDDISLRLVQPAEYRPYPTDSGFDRRLNGRSKT